jgi:sensor c-di-GMP phosphodiesterase-like protein
MLPRWRDLRSYLAFGIVGASFGYAGYQLISIRRAESALAQYSEHLLARSDAASLEAREVLAAMEAVPLPYCSTEEMDVFGQLLFQARYLRDLGHMRDGIVDCSTVLGELRDHQMMKLSFLQRDGTRVYSALRKNLGEALFSGDFEIL